MNAAYTGNLKELKDFNKRGILIDELSARYEKEFGVSSESQINSWKNSIPIVLESLENPRFDEIQVLIEYRLPIGEERVDMILLGGNAESKKGLVIELKQWNDFKFNPESNEINIFHFKGFGHPALQVLNYFGRLKHLHSCGEEYEFKPVLFMHNLSNKRKEDFYPENFRNLELDVFTVYNESMDNFAELCDEFLLPSKLAKDESIEFSKSPYKQTLPFFDLIRDHFNEIWEGASDKLSRAGFGLTENQKDIVSKIMESMKNNEKKVFLISGKPGSGKSLLAIYLLITSLSERRSSVFVARSNRFVPLIRDCLRDNIDAVNGVVIYVDSRMGNNFIGRDNFRGVFDFVICDEAQRFRQSNIKNIMKRSPVTVFFHDEQQILNPPEEGWKKTFFEEAFHLKKDIVELKLDVAIRCRGGEDYHEWIEKLLNLEIMINPPTELKNLWENRYKLKLFDDIIEMKNYMKKIHEIDNNNVALVASFTESDGKPGRKLRVGYPLQSDFNLYKGMDIRIDWLMEPNEYRHFWLQGGSNNLANCASIYGSQGFESDYIGIIWGRDFVIRNGKWSKGELPVNYDNIDGLSLAARNDLPLYLKLIQNRYRIFLTRGMLGTFIFCEDEETREYLGGIIN